MQGVHHQAPQTSIAQGNNVALGSVTLSNDQPPNVELAYMKSCRFVRTKTPPWLLDFKYLSAGSQDGARAQRISSRTEILPVLALPRTHRGIRKCRRGGVSVSVAGQWVPRNTADAIDSGVFPPWPTVQEPGGTKYISPPPDPQKLSTYVRWQNLCLAVYTGSLGAEAVHARFECAAANHVILLKGIESRSCPSREEMQNVRRRAGLTD